MLDTLKEALTTLADRAEEAARDTANRIEDQVKGR